MAFQVTWHSPSSADAAVGGLREVGPSDSFTIGREDGVDVVLKDASVSRLHAEIFVSGNGVHVVDKGSANGVRIGGSRVKEAIWLPGQKLEIGRYVFELTPQQRRDQPQIEVPSPSGWDQSQTALPSRDSTIYSGRTGRQSIDGGRIALGDVFVRARQNDVSAVRELFAGFMGRSEHVVDCGYLGALGFVFPEYSFWCVTNSRVCGLLINRGGWINFNFGFHKSLNRGVFVQPSIVTLWITVIMWCLFVLAMALTMGGWIGAASGYWTGVPGIAWLMGIVAFVLVLGCGAALIPFVVRAYYRWVKAGCIFWTRERVPIVIPSDRYSLANAQRFMTVFMDQKRMVGD